MIRRRLYAECFLIAALGLGCRAPAKPSSMQLRFDMLNKVDEVMVLAPVATRAATMGALYDEFFASARLEQGLDRIGDQDLDLLYRAASLTEYDTANDKYVRDMQAYLGALQDRNLASNLEVVQMYRALVSTRRLTEATELARRHPLPEMNAFPAWHDASGLAAGLPTELALDLDRHELIRRSVDLHQAAQIVVVGQPSCHFTQNAMQDIQADPVLGGIFRSHARWLAPQESVFDWNAFEQWNRSHPEQELAVAFRRDEWPMIDSWNLPTFYFFKNGVLQTKFFGWPKQGRRSELLAALQQIGLAP
jgi:hypothetical protein